MGANSTGLDPPVPRTLPWAGSQNLLKSPASCGQVGTSMFLDHDLIPGEALLIRLDFLQHSELTLQANASNSLGREVVSLVVPGLTHCTDPRPISILLEPALEGLRIRVWGVFF